MSNPKFRDSTPPPFAPRYGGNLSRGSNIQRRFKRSFENRVRIGILAAVVLHVAALELLPRMSVTETAVAAEALIAVELPPVVEIPPPPDAIARPATPKVALVEVSDELTIAPTTFEANPAGTSVGPPPVPEAKKSDRPTFIPFDVPPVLLNRREVAELLKQLYPPRLREVGVDARVMLWIFISEVGEVREVRVSEPSGWDEVDEAARLVAREMEFSPAKNRDAVTPVWLSIPISFEVTG